MVPQIRMIGTVLALLLTGSRVCAFEQLGHQLVCDIAWREMAKATRPAVTALLRQTSHRTLAHACTWADRIRDRPEYAALKPQHYINVPRTATRIDTTAPCGHATCILEAITVYTAVLRGEEPADDRYLRTPAQALLMLGHLVGDIHQPLHVSYADDLGGNRVAVNFSGETTNLHRLWDRHLVAELTANTSWRDTGRQLFATLTDRQRTAWADMNVHTWANESLTLTRTIYARLPADKHLPADYFTRNNPVVLRRIKMAGVRLARLLDSIFVTSDTKP